MDDAKVAEAFRKCFDLWRAEVSVTHHHPEKFLVKFDRKSSWDRVLQTRKFNCEGLELHVRPWRSVRHAFGAAMFF